MSKFVASTNPNSIILIDRKAVRLSAKRDALGTLENYTFNGINFGDFPLLKGLPDEVKITLEISTDNEFERVDLGTKAAPIRKFDEPLNFTTNRSKPKWYLFVTENKNILARIENLIPDIPDDTETNGIIHVEPEDLGEILWRVDKDPARPILQVNNCDKLNMINRINEPIFRGLMFMSVLEQFLEVYVENPNAQSPGDWQENWASFFADKGMEDLPEGSDDDMKREWIEATLKLMSDMYKLKAKVLDSDIKL